MKMNKMEGAAEYFSNFSLDLPILPYIPGRYVAVSVENVNKGIKTQGTGFKTAIRNGLVPLKVLYGNERFQPGMVVWIEAGATKLPWAMGDFQFNITDGPTFALLPEDYIKVITHA